MFNLTRWEITAAIASIPILYWLNIVRKVKQRVAKIKKYNLNKNLRIYPLYVPMAELFFRFELMPSWLNPFPKDWRTDPHTDCYSEDGVLVIVSQEMTTFRVANENLIHQVYDRKNDFGKPIHLYGILDVFGRNVVTTEGTEWKRHRKITAPQFSEKNNALVFDVTRKSIAELLQIWKVHGHDKVDVLRDMFQLAMHVISGAAFGVQLKFNETEKDVAPGHKLTFKQALQGLNEHLGIYIALPKWLVRALPFKIFKDATLGVDEFNKYMEELYEGAANSKKEESNLLHALVQSVKSESGEATLTVRELLGNMFIFLFAGHETTANTLTFALASLGLNLDIQNRLLDEIKVVLGDGEFTYAKLNQMPYTLAVMYEALRMYSPVESVPKMAIGDQKLGDYLLPDETNVSLHTFRIQYSPQHWGPDPDVFRPERWFADPKCASDAKYCFERTQETALKSFFKFTRYAFIPFSDGPRSCLGRRFAEVEFMTAIVALVRELEFRVPKGTKPEVLLKSKVTITYRPTQPVELIISPRS